MHSLNCSSWSDYLSIKGYSTTKKSRFAKLRRQKNWNWRHARSGSRKIGSTKAIRRSTKIKW